MEQDHDDNERHQQSHNNNDDNHDDSFTMTATAIAKSEDTLRFQSNRYYILIEFVYKHIDFHLAELQSILEMNDIHIDLCSTIATTATTSGSQDNEDDMIRIERLPNFHIHKNSNILSSQLNDNICESQDLMTATATSKITTETDKSHDTNDDNNNNNQHDNQNMNPIKTEGWSAKQNLSRKKKNEGKTCRPFLVLSFHSSSRWVPNRYQCQMNKTNQNNDDDNESKKSNNKKIHDIATIILSRCVLVRSVIELWGMGVNFEECVQCCQRYIGYVYPTTTTTTCKQQNNDAEMSRPNIENKSCTPSSSSLGATVYQMNREPSWKMTVHTLGSKYTRDEQNEMRSYFSFLEFTGVVQMKDPVNEYIVIREQQLDCVGSPIYPRHGHNKQLILENDKVPPLSVYFGRILYPSARNNHHQSTSSAIASYRNDNDTGDQKKPSSTKRNNKLYIHGISIDELSLKKRIYLGPTSMDTELSIIMTNLAQVSATSCVFDPFVGTGSILLSCALHGAYVVGTDIDLLVLRGKKNQRLEDHHKNQGTYNKNQDQTIFANFELYHLPRPELVRSDNSIYHRHFRCYATTKQHNQSDAYNTGKDDHVDDDHDDMDVPLTLYDAIVTDPPYGIRAGARRTGTRRAVVTPVLEENRYDHIAQTKPYEVSDVMADLVDVAAHTLELNGRLVYIIPSFDHNFNPLIDLPHHDCLQLIHCCYQPLSTIDLGRRIIVMKKVQLYDPRKRTQYLANIWRKPPQNEDHHNDSTMMTGAEKCANIREKLINAAKLKPNYEEKKLIRTHKRKRLKEERKQLHLLKKEKTK